MKAGLLSQQHRKYSPWEGKLESMVGTSLWQDEILTFGYYTSIYCLDIPGAPEESCAIQKAASRAPPQSTPERPCSAKMATSPQAAAASSEPGAGRGNSLLTRSTVRREGWGHARKSAYRWGGRGTGPWLHWRPAPHSSGGAQSPGLSLNGAPGPVGRVCVGLPGEAGQGTHSCLSGGKQALAVLELRGRWLAGQLGSGWSHVVAPVAP